MLQHGLASIISSEMYPQKLFSPVWIGILWDSGCHSYQRSYTCMASQNVTCLFVSCTAWRGLTLCVLCMQVAAPLVGGVLAQSLGWRSTFAALAIMCGLAAMLLLVCMRRETHSTMRLEKIDPDAAYAMEEWEAGIATPPQFVTPWTPIM